MAVQKKKKSPAKRNMKRFQKKCKHPTISITKRTNPHLRHYSSSELCRYI
ncbi:50S ribosomal protein L32 [Candidatus Tremblaya phenacola]|uniref:Large ribosomal subunit protein bL32 n=1 Tax=Candidatus Tremblayella phenacoccinincola TaxID=1010676 RepID=A0A2G0V717_9PROT|nr:50S ribosomal protein L32 [Candidatus Tremblaya phenacola]